MYLILIMLKHFQVASTALFLLPSPRWIVIRGALIRCTTVWRLHYCTHNGRNFGNFCLNYVERIVETGDAIGASLDRNSRNVPLEFSSVAGKARR